jgi:muramoyltetrapeptide carboxypeptidase
MISPKYLVPGDKVGLAAPSRSIVPEEIEKAIVVLKERNLIAVPGKNLFKKYNQFAGTDAERSEDLQYFLDNPEIKAIMCVRGGYGSIRTIQNLSFKKFVRDPKWFVGYSDITVFHSYINTQLKIETLHAPMVFNFGKDDKDPGSVEKTFACLFGEIPEYHFETNLLNKNGAAEGIVTGGNLSVLYSLRGTPADIDTKNKILFIEDLDEYLYHIDRMMLNSKHGNKLNNLRAVLVGAMSDMKDNQVPFGKTVYEIISEVVSDKNIPVCFGFPAGHEFKNWPLIMGRKASLEIGKSCSLKFA